MKKRNLIFLSVLVVLATVGIIFKKNVTAPVDTTVPTQSQAVPDFSWRFEEATTNNPDGNPQTSIYLNLTYSGSDSIDSRLVDTSDGGCTVSVDVADKSIIQCYYAGAGNYYKVTQGDKKFVILKKGFEEGSPDYNPPAQEYKPFVEIPL